MEKHRVYADTWSIFLSSCSIHVCKSPCSVWWPWPAGDPLTRMRSASSAKIQSFAHFLFHKSRINMLKKNKHKEVKLGLNNWGEHLLGVLWLKLLDVSGTDGVDSSPVIKASQEEKKKRHATDSVNNERSCLWFLLKHQPLEYYKCHLHAVLENGRGRGALRGRRTREAWWWWSRNLWTERDVFISDSEWQRCEICLIFRLTERH